MRFTEKYNCPNCETVFRAGEGDAFRHGDIRTCTRCRTQVVIVLPLPAQDNTPYGNELACRVADHLASGQDIVNNHPYFCGTGLGFRDGEFVHGYVEDGQLTTFRESTDVLHRLPDQATFVAWLAVQSDDTLYGHEEPDEFRQGNQRINRERLELAIKQKHAAQGPSVEGSP